MKFGIGNKAGRLFTSYRQPKLNGRKRSLYKNLTKQAELSREDFMFVIRYLVERTPNELDRLIKDKSGKLNKEIPIWIINIISAINADIKHGQVKTLNILFDHMFGKPVNSVKAITTVIESNAKRMTENEINDEIHRIDQLIQRVNIKRKIESGTKKQRL